MGMPSMTCWPTTTGSLRAPGDSMNTGGWFPSMETIELVLSNHRHEMEQWPKVTVIPLAISSKKQQSAFAPKGWTRKERNILALLASEPLINAEEIRVYFHLPLQRARLLVSEARRRRLPAVARHARG